MEIGNLNTGRLSNDRPPAGRPENRPVARQMINAAFSCSLFVLLWHPDLLGGHREIGVAQGSALLMPDKRIFVVGSNFRQSIFDTDSPVSIFATSEEMLGFLSREQ